MTNTSANFPILKKWFNVVELLYKIYKYKYYNITTNVYIAIIPHHYHQNIMFTIIEFFCLFRYFNRFPYLKKKLLRNFQNDFYKVPDKIFYLNHILFVEIGALFQLKNDFILLKTKKNSHNIIKSYIFKMYNK